MEPRCHTCGHQEWQHVWAHDVNNEQFFVGCYHRTVVHLPNYSAVRCDCSAFDTSPSTWVYVSTNG